MKKLSCIKLLTMITIACLLVALLATFALATISTGQVALLSSNSTLTLDRYGEMPEDVNENAVASKKIAGAIGKK